MMTFIFAMIAALIIGFGLSYVVTGMFMDTSVIGESLASMGITSDLLNIGPGLIVIALISLLLAYMIFALISALNGAGCSNMEDVEAANTTAVMVVMAGYLVSVIGTSFGSDPSLFLSAVSYSFGIFSAYLLRDWGYRLRRAYSVLDNTDSVHSAHTQSVQQGIRQPDNV